VYNTEYILGKGVHDMAATKETPEQQAIIDSQADYLVVNAFAGTGKTTTLVGYAKARPKKKMLYVAFNKAIQVEAKSKFPKNVECRTTHSIAYEKVGSKYKDKLGSMRVGEVAKLLNLARLEQGRAVLSALEGFMSSASEKIEVGHIDPVFRKDGEDLNGIVYMASSLWERMINLDDKEVKLPHDGYLKLYQLSKPILKGYDIILFDEAQDANPVTTDIVMRQDCGKVLVGDSHHPSTNFAGRWTLWTRQNRISVST